MNPPDPPPAKPAIFSFTKSFKIEAGDSKTFFVGDAKDYLDRPVTVTWEFVGTKEVDYVKKVESDD